MTAELEAFFLAHRWWAGPVFGLLAFGESLALVGAAIPATPILFLMGVLLGSGTLDPLVIMPWAMAGAIGGYWLSWVLGRVLGPRAFRSRWLADHRRAAARTRLYFRRWGGPSLVLGRYVLGPFQSLLPFVAGTAGMPARRFHAWNVLSGVLWVVVVLTPGFLTARGIALFGASPDGLQGLSIALLAVSGGAIVLVVGAAILSRGRSRAPNGGRGRD